MSLPEIIRTDRLELRPFSAADAPAVLDYSEDESWRRYQQTTPRSLPEAEGVVAELMRRDRQDEPVWAITRAGAVVGIVSLVFRADHRIARLGYGIHRDHRRLGLTGEGVRAVLAEAFRGYPQLAKVAAHTDARNLVSIALLRKLGFSHEGTLRSNEFAKGEFVDDAVYGLLRSEWDSRGRPEVDPQEVRLQAVGPESALLLSNLLELYVHDMSEIFPSEPGEDGRFGYAKLPLYWSEPERRFAFLIRAGARVAGFALVTRGSPATDDPEHLDVAEFFVLRGHRRSGVGARAACQLWDRLPGHWLVRVSEGNRGGVSFWRKTVGQYTGGAFSESGLHGSPHAWRVFAFESAGR